MCTLERIMQCQMRLYRQGLPKTRDSIKKEYVREQLTKMKEQCAACKSSPCRIVAACLKGDSRYYCYSCHAYCCGNNYHQNCIARWIDNDGQSCSYCFLALDKDIPESSTRNEHEVGHCIYKDLIKRVLLYQVSIKKDKGVSAKLLLDGCLRNNEVWYEQMGKNLRLIEDLEVILQHQKNLKMTTFKNSGKVY